jgi:hypothetical protein
VSTKQDLIAAIKNALAITVTSSLTSKSAVSDLYEAYLFGLVLRAARIEGATVTLRTVTGASPTTFIFRTSPGFINSKRQNYGFADIAFPNCPILEAHVGVRVAGQSNVLHECDISVIDHAEAQLCRQSSIRIAPRSARVRLAVEAKCYTTDLALHLGRGFLGLVRDLSCDSTHFVINRNAPSVEKLLAHKGQLWEHRVLPSNAIPVARLTNALQTAFKNYKAKFGN